LRHFKGRIPDLPPKIIPECGSGLQTEDWGKFRIGRIERNKRVAETRRNGDRMEKMREFSRVVGTLGVISEGARGGGANLQPLYRITTIPEFGSPTIDLGARRNPWIEIENRPTNTNCIVTPT
jgi:hypothetical protein